MSRRKNWKPRLDATHFSVLWEVRNVAEVAALCMVSKRTVRRWCEEGKIAARQSNVGGGWLISKQSLIEFLQLRQSSPQKGRHTYQ